jgi:hypothetical protein
MKLRFLCLAFSAALASATPLTLTLVGIGSGTLNGVSFVDQTFTFTFNTDTTSILQPGSIASEPADWSTPLGTAATIAIMGLPTATLTDGQAIFDHPSPENRLGIWQNLDQDYFTITDPAFASYNFTSNLTVHAPATEVTALANPTTNFITSTGGPLVLSSVMAGSTVTFTATLATPPPPPTTPPTVSAVPEPSTASLLLLGVAGLGIGIFRKR